MSATCTHNPATGRLACGQEAVRSMAADLAAIDSNMDTTRRELLASYGLSPGQIAAVLHGPTLDTMRGILLAEREPGVES